MTEFDLPVRLYLYYYYTSSDNASIKSLFRSYLVCLFPCPSVTVLFSCHHHKLEIDHCRPQKLDNAALICKLTNDGQMLQRLDLPHPKHRIPQLQQ